MDQPLCNVKGVHTSIGIYVFNMPMLDMYWIGLGPSQNTFVMFLSSVMIFAFFWLDFDKTYQCSGKENFILKVTQLVLPRGLIKFHNKIL